MGLKSKIMSKVSEIQANRKKAEAEQQKHIYEKIQSIKESIEHFKKELSEEFILGTNISGMFKECFGSQFSKKGFSATKRWCEDVFKKLKKLDDSNRVLRAKYAEPITTTFRMSRGGEDVESKSTSVGTIPPEFKKQNIKEFKKIFYNNTDFDGGFLGMEIKVKATFSQKAAINAVKKELNQLCNEKNFAPKSSK